MPSADLSRRVEKVVGHPPLSEMGEQQRQEFHEALLEADSFEGSAGEVAGGGPRRGTESAETTCRQRRLSHVSNTWSSRHKP